MKFRKMSRSLILACLAAALLYQSTGIAVERECPVIQNSYHTYVDSVETGTESIDGGQIKEAIARWRYDRPIVKGQVINGEKLAAVQNVADALREMAGVQVKDYGGVGGFKTINVRSLGSEYTGVYIDGIQVENAQNMQVDLGRFSTDGLGSITLYNGQRSLRLQSAKEYASGSSIYLSLSPAKFEQGHKSAFMVRLKGGSFGTFSPAFSWSQRFKKGVIGSLNAEFLNSNGKYKFHTSKYIRASDGSIAGYDTTMTRKNGDITAFRAEARLENHSSSVSSWRAHAYFYDSERGLPGAVVRTASGLLPGYGDRQADRDFFLQGSYRRAFSGVLQPMLLVRGKYSHNYTRYRTDPEKNPQSMPTDVTYRQNSGYLSVSEAFSPKEWWGVNIAIDGQYNALDGDSQYFARPQRLSVWGALASDLRWNWGKVSANALYTAAWDWYDNTSAGAFSRENKTRTAFSPAVLFSLYPFWRQRDHTIKEEYPLADATQGSAPIINGFVKRSFRMPSFNDLYYTLVGNSALKCETAWQMDVGVSWPVKLSEGLILIPKTELYHNSVDDKIVTIPTSSMFRWTMYNIGKVNVWGADVIASLEYSAAGQSRNRLSDKYFSGALTLKYTYQKATDRSDPSSSSYGGQIPYIPLHSGSASLWGKWHGYRLDFTAIATGERWSSSANFIDYHIDPWWTADVSASKEINISRQASRLSEGGNHRHYAASAGALLITLSVRNILNRQYEVVQGYPMPGTNFLAGVEYRF